jgi:hypothetical protein
MRPVFAARPDLAAKFYRLFSAVNLRRAERNATLQVSSGRVQCCVAKFSGFFFSFSKVAERQRKGALFSTSRQELLSGAGGGDKMRKSVMLSLNL